jgi:short subunit fatty acids transporter
MDYSFVCDGIFKLVSGSHNMALCLVFGLVVAKEI